MLGKRIWFKHIPSALPLPAAGPRPGAWAGQVGSVQVPGCVIRTISRAVSFPPAPRFLRGQGQALG